MKNKKKKLTNKQLEELHMNNGRYDYCFCSEDNGTEQYSVKCQYKAKDAEFWKDIEVFVFNVNGKDDHNKAVSIIKARLGNDIVIKNCMFH